MFTIVVALLAVVTSLLFVVKMMQKPVKVPYISYLN